MKAEQIVKRYISFFEKKGHQRIANSPLVLVNDPTTLFTSSGMQALIPYLLGETHAAGKRLVNVQNCLRSQDIEEVGDNRHTTFFRMLGNWSLGDPASPGSTSQGGYFKKEQLPWFFTFLTDNEEGLGLDPNNFYVSVFSGNNNIPKDEESIEIWQQLFKEKNIDAKVVTDAEENGMQGGRIFTYGVKKNWWSRAGVPENMPPGEPGGPDSEVFYDFGADERSEGARLQGEAEDKGGHTIGIHENSIYKDKPCHPNCDCGRFMEIGNSVFMQYIKQENGTFKELPQKNVDFGGGLERLAAAKNHNPDVFTTDLYSNIIATIEEVTGKSYSDHKAQTSMRVIADHLKAATFLMVDGVVPSNKEQGYVLRRLLRRAAVKMHQLQGSLPPVSDFQIIIDAVLETEERVDDKINRSKQRSVIFPLLDEELGKFAKSLEKGLKELEKNIEKLDEISFDLYQTHGFPFEIIEELAHERGKTVDRQKFQDALNKHRDLSRSASAGMFKGGLADQSEKTVMGHTATHLLHQALRDVLGNTVHQSGSNITSERVRFDFNFDRKLTDEEVKEVEAIVNDKIKANLPVHFELIPTKEAYEIGAIGLFMDTYGEKSKIYFIGGTNPFDKASNDKPYSIEFCGGPHVEFTGVLKSFKIIKQENLGKGMKRIYAVVEGNENIKN